MWTTAAASVHVMELSDAVYRAHTQPMLSHINVGTGVDCTIRELAQTIALDDGLRAMRMQGMWLIKAAPGWFEALWARWGKLCHFMLFQARS